VLAGTQIPIAPTIIATRIRQPFQSLPNSRREHVSYVLAQVRRQVQAGAVGKIDEIHNLNLATRAGADASDQLKYLAERILATFIYVGVDVEGSGLLAGTGGCQIAGGSA